MRLSDFNNAVSLLEQWIEHAQLAVPYYPSNDAAPNTYKDMRESYDKHKIFFINSEASDTTIYSHKKYNIMFRAIHDKMHYDYELSFKFEDEKTLSKITEQVFLQWCLDNNKCLDTAFNAMKVINAEIRGQIEFYEENNDFVVNQKEYVLDYLNVLT